MTNGAIIGTHSHLATGAVALSGLSCFARVAFHGGYGFWIQAMTILDVFIMTMTTTVPFRTTGGKDSTATRIMVTTKGGRFSFTHLWFWESVRIIEMLSG